MSDDPGDGLMSQHTDDIVAELYNKFKDTEYHAMIHYTHRLPEWRGYHGSVYDITARDILRAENTGTDEINDIMAFVKETTAEMKFIDDTLNACQSEVTAECAK
jgi:hypothetical protein